MPHIFSILLGVVAAAVTYYLSGLMMSGMRVQQLLFLQPYIGIGFGIVTAISVSLEGKSKPHQIDKTTPAGTSSRVVPSPAPAISPISVEDPEVLKARRLAEIEIAKAAELTKLRVAETEHLAGIAQNVADREEARQDRQLDKLTKI